MIYVQRTGGGPLKVRVGQRQLRATLAAFGYANVTDVETDEQFRVHEVDGQIMLLMEPIAASSWLRAGLNSSRKEPTIPNLEV